MKLTRNAETAPRHLTSKNAESAFLKQTFTETQNLRNGATGKLITSLHQNVLCSNDGHNYNNLNYDR